MKNTLTILALTLALGTTAIYAKTAGTVNGIIITVEEADKALNIISKGTEKWDTLTAEKKKQVLQMMAPSKLVAQKASKSLNKKEKEAAYSAFWMQKKMGEANVTDEEAKTVYDKMKASALKAKSNQPIPEFEIAKNSIKMQIAQEKVLGGLMKSAKVKVK
ncbi:MAG: hypothetical protein GQ531_11140 [Sulfurovum sp.]|nr:hypothetical protein [Sulfurovum sp.]